MGGSDGTVADRALRDIGSLWIALQQAKGGQPSVLLVGLVGEVAVLRQGSLEVGDPDPCSACPTVQLGTMGAQLGKGVVGPVRTWLRASLEERLTQEAQGAFGGRLAAGGWGQEVGFDGLGEQGLGCRAAGAILLAAASFASWSDRSRRARRSRLRRSACSRSVAPRK